MKLGNWQKIQKLHIYSVSAVGVEIELIFALWAVVSEIQANFQLQYLGMKLEKLPKFQMLHIYSLSTSGGPKFHATGSARGFWHTGQIFETAIFVHETWQLAKFSEVAHIFYFSRGSKLSVSSCYGQWFLRYRLAFTIAIFGHGTWQLAKVPEVAHIHFLPQGGEIELIFHSTDSGFWDRCQFSKLPYLGTRLGKWPMLKKLLINSLSIPLGRIWAYFCSTGSGFWNMGHFSKLPYLGMKLGHWQRISKLHIYFRLEGVKMSLFCSTGSGLQEMVRF